VTFLSAISIMSFVHWDAFYILHLGSYPAVERGAIMLGVGIASPFAGMLLGVIGDQTTPPRPYTGLNGHQPKARKSTRPLPSEVSPPMAE